MGKSGCLTKQDGDVSGDEVVDVARIEELSAARCGGPALAREHGKVGDGSET